MALFITVSMPADGRAHRDETRGGTILISMLQQLPHHSRIICTRKYTTVARTCKPRLICLWPSAATITTMTTRRTPAASNVGQGCVTTGVCHGTRSDTIRSDQRDSALGGDLFPACFATRSAVHTTTTCFLPSFGSSGQHCTAAREKRRRVCCSCHLSIAVGARHDLPTDCLPDCGCHAVCPCPAALLLTCPIRAVSFILQGRG